MAVLEIKRAGDPVLKKVCEPVKRIDKKVKRILKDMADTLYKSGNGIGLAAPQVGILQRIVVIDVTMDQSDPMVFINPVIVEQSGEQTGYEGCLSVPGKMGMVTRPDYVKATAYDANMQPIEVEGHDLLARCMCHEFDHLDGKLYTRLVEGGLVDSAAPEEDE